MMRPLKYNPSFLSDEELLANFSVRQSELKAMMDCVRKNSGKANLHTLLVGARGSGKTMLLRRFLVEVRSDAKLASLWHPVIFSEENYEILSLDDLWLQTLYYLASPLYGTLKAQGGSSSETENTGLAHVLDFADQIKRRILLVCENMGQLFETLPDEDVLKLKAVLQSEPRIMLVGSSTTPFDEPGHPFYDFFRTIPLERLSAAECSKLWMSVAEKKISPSQARALEILTGGSPRLLSILAWFGKDLSFLELMKELEMLVDDHTDYFRGQMEALPPKERKVFATLARLWRNSTSAEVAAEARMEQPETASLLSRLSKRGLVEKLPSESPTKRRQTYQLSERLFNIYYLMRLGGRSSLWVRPVVEFLAQVFGADIREELYALDYSTLDGRALRCAGMLMTAVNFGETLDKEAIGYFESGDINKAFELGKKAWETQAKALGEEHPSSLKALNHLAAVYLALGDSDKAIELSGKAYGAMARLLGEDDAETLCALGTHATAHAQRGNSNYSLDLLKRLCMHPEFLGQTLQYANTLCTTLAAMEPDVAEAVLKIIENSPSHKELHVLVIGIKAYLGHEFRAPQEVREIAEDIKKWITQMASHKNEAAM
ncbi:MAG: ATP-binding protein [Fretibacterium sp.]|nr:ATP-binding protein [Fretibacterium sp.]